MLYFCVLSFNSMVLCSKVLGSSEILPHWILTHICTSNLTFYPHHSPPSPGFENFKPPKLEATHTTGYKKFIMASKTELPSKILAYLNQLAIQISLNTKDRLLGTAIKSIAN